MAEVMAAVAPEGLLATEPPVDIETRAARFAADLTRAWVVVHDGCVVGHGGLHETSTKGVLTFGMALLPEARGRGAGRTLMDALIGAAREQGAHKLELEVWPDNARAIALYVSFGFSVEGVRRDHYRRRDGSLRTAMLMARAV